MIEQGKRDEPAGAATPPDAAPVNEAWRAEAAPRDGWRGLADRLAARWLGPRFESQRRFNAAQVQLDNALLEHLDARFAAAQGRLDRLTSEQGQRLDDIDERHRLLEKELLRHVQDLVTRIDLVLTEANREKAALAFALEDARARLARLEEALRRK